MAEKTFLVTNRSASRVYYSVPELGIKSRSFAPGETKKIKYEELEGLNYLPGGPELIKNFLLIQNEEVREELVGEVEPEYNMTPEQVRDLILTGSHDEWLDCLDFAPEGVIDLIKTLSVELPLTDTVKMEYFKQKKGIDLARMIQARKEDEAEEAALKEKEQTKPQRRVQPKKDEPASNRRTSGSKYKVVKKETSKTE